MNIVHVLQWLELGGGESLALRLAAGQREAGHAVSVLAFTDGSLGEEFRAHGVDVALMPKKAGFDVSLYSRLALYFWSRRVQVVHTHDQQSLVYAAMPARLAGAKVVHTKHGDTLETARRMALRRLAARAVHAFVAVSPATAETARRHREADPKRMQIIWNGVDLEQFRPDPAQRVAVRRELGLREDAWVLGTVGRHEEEKDPVLLLRAALPLLSERSALCLVGSGSLTEQLRRLQAELPGGRYVHILGKRRDVARLIASFDVFALSSRTEGLPLVLLEAMATGVPVVSTAVGGIPALLERNACGILVPPGDEGALRAALKSLRDDPELARSMGREALGLAKAFSFEKTADAYLALYGEGRSAARSR